MVDKTKTYNIGKLTKNATIRYYTTVSDGMGGSLVTWNDGASIWCDITPLSANEVLQYGAVNSNVTHKIIARYRPNLTHENKLKLDNRIFSITAVLNAGEQGYITELLAHEEVQHGNDS
jgi:SPP1 family predicted phage head-tail adaptor